MDVRSGKIRATSWWLFGYDVDETDQKFQELLKKYKAVADFRTIDGRTIVFINDPFRIDSIRKRLWGHRWATHKNWVSENPDLADFDPRRKKQK